MWALVPSLDIWVNFLSPFSVPTLHPVVPATRMVCLTGRKTKGKFSLIRRFRAHRICNSPASAQESGFAYSIPPSPYPFTVLSPVSSLSLQSLRDRMVPSTSCLHVCDQALPPTPAYLHLQTQDLHKQSRTTYIKLSECPVAIFGLLKTYLTV